MAQDVIDLVTGYVPEAFRLYAAFSYDPTIPDNLIGDGGYAKVYRGKYGENDVAVKVIHQYQKSTILNDFLIKEVPVWFSFRHPNVMPLYGIKLDENEFLMVTDLMDKSLNVLLSGGQVGWVEKLQYSLDIVAGLAYIHAKNYIHRDLKGQNILVSFADYSGKRVAKIADFGFSRKLTDDGILISTTPGGLQLGTPGYMAPEIFLFDASNQTIKVDIYALGVTFYEILMGPDCCDDHIRTQPRPSLAHRLHFSYFEMQYVQLMESCWAELPQDRPSAHEIMSRLNQMRETMVLPEHQATGGGSQKISEIGSPPSFDTMSSTTGSSRMISSTTPPSRSGATQSISFIDKSQWIPDEKRSSCGICQKPFNILNWRHHCRGCGEIFCDTCAPFRAFASVRLCHQCVQPKPSILSPPLATPAGPPPGLPFSEPRQYSSVPRPNPTSINPSTLPSDLPAKQVPKTTPKPTYSYVEHTTSSNNVYNYGSGVSASGNAQITYAPQTTIIKKDPNLQYRAPKTKDIIDPRISGLRG